MLRALMQAARKEGEGFIGGMVIVATAKADTG
jgi:hypothetical protein